VTRSNDFDRAAGTSRPGGAFTSWEELRQPIVFCIVGVLLALIYFVVAYVATSAIGLKPEVASVCAYVLMIPCGYFAHRIITFRSSAVHSVAFPRFLVTSCMGVALSWVIPYVASQLFAVPHWVAFLAVCAIVPALSFVTTRAWVFVEARGSSHSTDVIR
jgi:putative flippase GtrA